MELYLNQEYKRKEIHDFYKGQRQGGISTPAKHPIIFLFPTQNGKDFGYEDSPVDPLPGIRLVYQKDNHTRGIYAGFLLRRI